MESVNRQIKDANINKTLLVIYVYCADGILCCS